MPFIPGTPESRLGRTDSMNPDTTCRGITSSGRPCRRPLNASSDGPQESKKRPDRLRADDDLANPDLYCHQHKDQANASAHSSPGHKTSNAPVLGGRESLDTLFDRLGVVEEQQKKNHRRKKTRRSSDHHGDGGRHEEKPPGATGAPVSEAPHKPRPATAPRSFLCCCFRIPFGVEEQGEEEEEPARPARPKPRPAQPAPADAAASRPPSSSHHPTPGPRPGPAASKHPSAQPGGSQTSELMSLISAQTPPQTASQLLAELAKPPSAQDEPGYIYIFWLTPESATGKPPTDAARSLLAPPSKSSDARQRRPSDALERYAAENSPSPKSRSRSGGKDKDGKHDKSGGGGGGGGGKKTILLKIGRASNVQRRLNEWQRQCGYDIDLIRYYPYVPSQSDQDAPRKMPHSHKVERLVHIELAGLGLRASDRGEACAACGRAHREWFEVEASRGGVQVVDGIVRRWSDWDEGRGAAR